MTGGAGSAAVRVQALGKRFGAVSALHGVGFEVRRGEVFGLVGPDGAGKTTAMRMLAGVMTPDEGSIVVEGVDVVARPEDVRQRISYMPQRFALYEDLTVDENIRFYADVFEVPRRLREERSARLLAASGMGAFRRRLAGQLSGGMKQKLGLTCALIHTPRLLLLDEPTTGVDPVSRREFWQILYGLRDEGVTILISTAYLDEAERCTRLALLHRGELRYCDTPDALRRLLPGAIVVVHSGEPARVRDALARAPGVSAVRVVGDGVRVLVDDPARRIPELEQALAALPGAHGPAAAGEAGIEDVFVALLQGDPPAEAGKP
ncbi:MAG TPA: ABC transporter ATP-binding protein [Burkholderiales bacterium]|nr:ABC transporter ATP-binding protein [Burkholderiales bacterium]